MTYLEEAALRWAGLGKAGQGVRGLAFFALYF